MNPDFLIPLAAIAIVMVGLVKIARHWSLGVQARNGGAVTRMLVQSQQPKQLGTE